MPNKESKPRTIDAADGSVVVKAPIANVYKRWLAFEDYPKFITAIKHVRKLDACRLSRGRLSCSGLRTLNESANFTTFRQSRRHAEH